MKKILSKIIVLTVLLSTQNLLAAFSGAGAGTAGDPYQITTPGQLDEVRNDLSSYFILNNDIDLDVSPYNTGTGWVALDDGISGFTGVFDGNGKKITGLKINTSTDYQGLFGYISGAKIKNLGLEGVDIVGGNYVGALAGAPSGNCKISNCYSTGNVSGTNIVGGLVGSIGVSDTVSNCYSRANVIGASNFGGLIGYAAGDAITVVSNCYSTGIVSLGGGGLIGAASGFNATACFWDTETSGQASSAGGTGKTTAEMKTQSTFTDSIWNFTPTTGIWEMIGTNYPRLQSVQDGALPVELTSFTASAGANSVTLIWNTATEVNNYGFEIERRTISNHQITQSSIDGWQKIGFVKGSGTSNASKEYSYSDVLSSKGRYAYRLKQVDNDGVYKYTTSVELEVKLAPATIGLVQNYPNPFNPNTQISFSVSNTEQARLAVYNLLGQHMMTLFDGIAIGQQAYAVSFDGTRFASGIYFYRLETPSRVEVRRMQLLK